MPQLKSFKFKTKLYFGYAGVLALLVILTTMVYLNLARLEKNREWVEHTYEAIDLAQKCGALMVDMETGVRGFLVAGQEPFLEPYYMGQEQFEKFWKSGREHNKNNPSQLQLWDSLKRKQKQWLDTVAKPEIDMRREVRKGEAATKEFEKISSNPKGKEIFDELRDHLSVLDNKFVLVNDHDGANLVMSIFTDMLNQETGQRGFILTGREENLESFKKGMADFDLHYKKLSSLNLENKGIWSSEILEIKTLVSRWHEIAILPEIKARRELNKFPLRLKDVAAILESGKGKRLMDEMRQIVAELVNEEKQLLFERSKIINSSSNRMKALIILGSLFAIVLGGLISLFIVRTTSRQLGTDPEILEDITDKLARGDLSIDLELENKDLTGVYASSIEMVKNMRAIVDQAKAVARGDYTKKIDIRSSKDQLGKALSQMTNELNITSERNKADNYLRIGQAKLNKKLSGENTISTITDSTIRFLSEYFEAQVGAFYLLTSENILELSASYAYQKRKQVSDKFKIGEGLVGQAAREQKPILISDIPDNYIHITSGLGNTVPETILVYPIKLDNTIKGVIELASIQMFTDQHIEFLDAVSQSIAVTLESSESRNEMAVLLEKTQDQAESLQSQQEELREANEILETQKKSLIDSERTLQEQQEELKQTNEELEEQTQLLEEQKSSIENKNTELEKTRQIIEEKAKDLELTSKYKSEFLANMSHELRTPLNSILLLSRLLADNKDDNLTTKQQEYSNTIHLSGTELLDLINEILDLSKVESGKMELHLENFNLNDMAVKFQRQFSPQAENKGLEFLVDLSSEIPERVKTDGQRLEQIIKNLISNALKFTTNGSISLKIERPGKDKDLSEYNLKPENSIAIIVSDTGEGIPTGKQKLIFEAFQQADGTTSRKYGGSGLGLSISRELVKLLGGVIELNSTPGKGSSFIVYLPEVLEKQFKQTSANASDSNVLDTRLEQTPELEVKKFDPIDPFGPDSVFIPDDRKDIKKGDKIILIIEDDSRFAKTLSDLSREREYKVLVAGDGETGLHFADYYEPNAIILDIGLPGMDGWSVMDRLKEHPRTRHIPVHFMSAHDKSVEARKMGAIGFITKPVTISLLDEAFEKIEHLISTNIRKLLVVEDDEVQRKAMVELIGNGDVQTTQAASGKEAFELLSNQVFDCIILDLGLPDISGVEFLTRIKENDTITEIPIIVYTGKELTSEEEAIINEYAEKIIIKGAKSAEKLIDETTLFLHRVEENLPEEKRRMIRVLHDRESVFTGKKILVVDDDMRNVYAITNVLEEKGLDVYGAQNGRKGVDTLESNPKIDLVLMDIMMPEMNGYEAIEIIRKNKKFKKLPIIALTAKAMKGDRKKCIEAGANDYLAKPVNIDKLLSMMRVWLY